MDLKRYREYLESQIADKERERDRLVGEIDGLRQALSALLTMAGEQRPDGRPVAP